MITYVNLDAVAEEVHRNNHKWWHTPDGKRLERNKGELIALIHSEASELLEAERSRVMRASLKIPDFTEAEEEMADLIIRALDYCGAFKLRISDAIHAKRVYNAQRIDHTHEHRATDEGKVF